MSLLENVQQTLQESKNAISRVIQTQHDLTEYPDMEFDIGEERSLIQFANTDVNISRQATDLEAFDDKYDNRHSSLFLNLSK